MSYDKQTNMWWPTGWSTWQDKGVWHAGVINPDKTQKSLVSQDAKTGLWLSDEMSKIFEGGTFKLVAGPDTKTWSVDDVTGLTLHADGTATLQMGTDHFVFPTFDVYMNNGKLDVARHEWTGKDWAVRVPEYSAEPLKDYPRFSEINYSDGNHAAYHEKVINELKKNDPTWKIFSDTIKTPKKWITKDISFVPSPPVYDFAEFTHFAGLFPSGTIEGADYKSYDEMPYKFGIDKTVISDLQLVEMSLDVQNSDLSRTLMPLISSPGVWKKDISSVLIHRLTIEATLGLDTPLLKLNPEYIGKSLVGAGVFLYPDANVDYIGFADTVPVLTESDGVTRRSAIINQAQNGIISKEASTELWEMIP